MKTRETQTKPKTATKHEKGEEKNDSMARQDDRKNIKKMSFLLTLLPLFRFPKCILDT
jgi:hypothetical protein